VRHSRAWDDELFITSISPSKFTPFKCFILDSVLVELGIARFPNSTRLNFTRGPSKRLNLLPFLQCHGETEDAINRNLSLAGRSVQTLGAWDLRALMSAGMLFWRECAVYWRQKWMARLPNYFSETSIWPNLRTMIRWLRVICPRWIWSGCLFTRTTTPVRLQPPPRRKVIDGLRVAAEVT